jgi:hypothetical protein
VQDLRNAPITSPGVDPHAELVLDKLCRRIEAACRKAPVLDVGSVARGVEPKPAFLLPMCFRAFEALEADLF